MSAGLRAGGFESVVRPDIMAWKHRKLLLNLGNAAQRRLRARARRATGCVDLARAEGEAVLAAAGIPVVSREDDDARCRAIPPRHRAHARARRRVHLAESAARHRGTWRSTT